MNAFHDFLHHGIERGGFSADDVLATVLPLMREVANVHNAGKVAPLRGTNSLQIGSSGHLTFDPAQACDPRRNGSRVDRMLEQTATTGVQVIGQSQHITDVDSGSYHVTDLNVGQTSLPITRPLYLPRYANWEHALDHHDELTDIFSLGMILASVACGLDFDDSANLELFVHARSNLFQINARLHPVIASIIGQMTELNRHKRAQDLGGIIRQLENYREQPVVELDTTFVRIEGFKESPLAGKRRIIQTHLRDRLFEITRRNRLIYFRPTMQTLNLTLASVPLMLDYRNIKLEQLFVWHSQLAETVIQGAPMSLGKYLRFEDAPYIPSVLDKIISEARRDRAEYGFAQLRLVICFLRWNNLKEAPEERIDSPLLLLPVELAKKKGVRDHYVLDPTSTEAEVNPALRHHLKQLYNLDLPESIELRETTLLELHRRLQTQIHASEPGVTLNLIDRPQIKLIHEHARQRVDQYRRRLKLKGDLRAASRSPEYSYNRENFRPLGLQLFLEKVRPRPLPMREVTGAPPVPRQVHIVDTNPAPSGKMLETERQMYTVRESDNRNPYSWEFDLCNITLGNFNYRKMTLVQDYNHLIESDRGSVPFDTVFSLSPRAEEEPPPALDLADQHLIIPSDATQAMAIAKVRSGRSYIIQGPPGTGKSQTITNLIADYVARGKRVLFVCEKRAAIDVVYHRLSQQGLDELCCLIHDSQTDKKAFIQNLKQTYEGFLKEGVEETHDRTRATALKAIQQDLAYLQRFSEAMQSSGAGVPLRRLLHRLVEVRAKRQMAPELAPEIEEQLPDYAMWLEHGELVERFHVALQDIGLEPCLARHTLRWLRPSIFDSDRPLESIRTCLDKAETLLENVEAALELSGLPAELWDTLEEIQALLQFAARVRPLAERNQLALLDSTSPEGQRFAELSRRLSEQQRVCALAAEQAAGWKTPLPPEEAANALSQARRFQGSVFRFLQPGYWRLRKIIKERYDFSRHVVLPGYVKVLEDLTRLQQARAAWEESKRTAQAEWQWPDIMALQQLVSDLRTIPAHPSVQAFAPQLVNSADACSLVLTLADIHGRFAELDQTLASLFAEHGQFDFPELTETLAALRGELAILPELMPLLIDFAQLPERFARSLRHIDLPLISFEPAIGRKSLNRIYREDRALGRVEGAALEQRIRRLERSHAELLKLNATCIRSAVRRKFLEHVKISGLAAAQLTEEQKAFKKTYATGRRELEHEFGKSMRYKSIRDLAAGDSGKVIQDLKPIWLMSPLSVSDTLPLDPSLFDVVIFDEASQIPVEEAVPALYRSNQVIVVGDEMQLPPTSFFSARSADEEGVVVEDEGERIKVDLDSDSFLTQSAINLPSTLLAWHYRSRYEALISFSNAAFYTGNLLTIPDRQLPASARTELRVTTTEQATANLDATLTRSISFHFLENGVYESRRNPSEAAYIAQLVRALLQRETKFSVGIVAFSEAQQTEIEEALENLGEEDADFSARLEAEFNREENDQFCGLFVKNLENVQGDERDIIILSVCYGYDAQRRMLMNFGPINQKGGEKRLNVIFSRAKHHMAIISSIKFQDITNEYNDGANSLRNFLQYAEATSRGDHRVARQVLENLNPLARKSLAPGTQSDAVIEDLAAALRRRGYEVDVNVGQSRFRCDLAIRAAGDQFYGLGILVDTHAHYENGNLLERYLTQPGILRGFGWKVRFVLTKDWFHDPEGVLNRIDRELKGTVPPDDESDLAPLDEPPGEPEPEPESPRHPEEVPADRQVSRRLEYVQGSSRKFWEITRVGNSFSVRFGRIGTSGQTHTKTFPNEAAAEREMAKLISEKLRKGYS